MFLFLKKKTEEAEAPEVNTPGRSKFPLSEFIPYYSHYNPHTLLTKNGELMQTIKIAFNNNGLNYESPGSKHDTIREIIRKAIAEHITTDKIAVWTHTIRKRKHIEHGGNFKEPFAAYVSELWAKKNNWKYQYYNEVYVTILHDGQTAPLLEKNTLRHALLPKQNRMYRASYLEAASKKLDEVVNAMLQTIGQRYQAERLSITEDANGTYYSEPMEFLGTLLNLSARPFALPEADISQALCTHTLTFGFNALESRDEAGVRRFAALMTMKQYREVPPETVDRILQSSTELVVSQAFHFTTANEALKQYKQQKELFDMSGDTYSIKASGLDEALRSNHNLPTDFVQHQTSIMILADEYKSLDQEIRNVHEAFYEMGLIMIREDIKLEECFWAQLPGNIEFIRRKQPISSSKVAGFNRLNLFPGGNNQGNHWGNALTLIPTTVKSPYFFNFHYQDNGHTVLFDFNSFHDQTGQVLLNFLLTSSLQYQGRIYLFDRRHSARLFFNKLGGQYHLFPGKTKASASGRLRMNPFLLEDNPRNRAFLVAWCATLVEESFPLSDAHKETVQNAIAQLYTAAPEHRNLSSLIETILATDTKLGEAFSAFAGNGKFAGWFDATSENLDLAATPLHAFNMDEAFQHQPSAIPAFSYLLHRVITEINGKPTIIVLHEAWDLLENAFFAPRLESLLEMLKQNNIMVIFTTSHPATCRGTRTLATLLKNCATRLYLPDDIAVDYTAQSLGLSEADSQHLLHMDRQKGHFLLKQNQENIALALSMDEMEDVRAIFANDIKNLIAAGGKFASLPKDY